MGRYYWGDIDGKFGFGCQSSNDADHFGYTGHPEDNENNWRCIHCYIEKSDVSENPTCYESEDEKHQFEASENYLVYKFTEVHLPLIKAGLNIAKKELNTFINDELVRDKLVEAFINVDSGEDDGWTIYTELVKSSNLKVEELDTLMCRILLGTKIYNCVLENDKCSFTAEL